MLFNWKLRLLAIVWQLEYLWGAGIQQTISSYPHFLTNDHNAAKSGKTHPWFCFFYLTLSKSNSNQINHQINTTFFFLTFHIEKQSMYYYSSLPSTEQLLQTSEKHCTAQKLFLENKSPKWHDHINQIYKIFFKLYQSWRLSIQSKIAQGSHYI